MPDTRIHLDTDTLPMRHPDVPPLSGVRSINTASDAVVAPLGWWVGWAGPMSYREAVQFAAVALTPGDRARGEGPYLCDAVGQRVVPSLVRS